MDYHAVYHCWSEHDEQEPYKNVRTPVVLSIATLRATSQIPITVLDMTERETDWDHFPDTLNFKVIRKQFSLTSDANHVKGYKHLSRIFDVHDWALENNIKSTVVYCDSDVFFLKDPFPLQAQNSHFCWDGWNTGFFYFNPEGLYYKSFYELFCKYTKEAIYSEVLRQEMKGFVGYDDWYGVWDEMVLGYMKNKHPEVFDLTPIAEHVTCRTLSQIDPVKAKIFHGNGSMVPNPITGGDHARGLLCLMIKEFYQKICKSLKENHLLEIFGAETLRYFKDKQFSLIDNAYYLEWIKNDKGLYELLRFSQNFHLI